MDATSVSRYLESYLAQCLETLRHLPLEGVARAIALLEEAREKGRRIFICGNGGSAATASHFANDLGKGASLHRARRFKVLALTDNVSWMTALANDLDFSQVFVEQLRNFAEPGDVLMAFSGSGQSPNVLRAVEWANAHGLVTIGFTGGRPGNRLAALSQLSLQVQSEHMGRIEDAHFLMQHLIGYYLMEQLHDTPENASP
ncbi:MAG: SIS domain-containing protein [Acidobacteriota bacterium]